jgi:O-succinylbenzoic acid--CoA ligase
MRPNMILWPWSLQAENSLAGLKDVKMIVGGAKMSKSLEKDSLKAKRKV